MIIMFCDLSNDVCCCGCLGRCLLLWQHTSPCMLFHSRCLAWSRPPRSSVNCCVTLCSKWNSCSSGWMKTGYKRHQWMLLQCEVFQSLVVTLTVSRSDCRNTVLNLISLLAYLVHCLQSVLHAAAQLIYHVRSANHITDAVASLTGCTSRSGSSTRVTAYWCAYKPFISQQLSFHSCLNLCLEHSAAGHNDISATFNPLPTSETMSLSRKTLYNASYTGRVIWTQKSVRLFNCFTCFILTLK